MISKHPHILYTATTQWRLIYFLLFNSVFSPWLVLAATLSANVGDKIIASIFPELISRTVLIQWSGWHSGIRDRPLYWRLCISGGKKH